MTYVHPAIATGCERGLERSSSMLDQLRVSKVMAVMKLYVDQ